MIAEYTAIRQEIGRCQDHQKDMMNLAFVLLGGTLGLIGTVAGTEGADRDLAVIFLLVPVLYTLLACTCADRARRMIDLACYLHYDLREKAKAAAGGTELWRWEAYKTDVYDKSNKWFQRRARVLDKARWLAFIVPSVLALGAYWVLAGFPTGAKLFLAIVDVLLIALSFYVLLLAGETAGIRDDPSAGAQ